MNGPEPLRLGILGTARIAPWGAINPARNNPAVTVTAVAARELVRAREFAARHAIPKAYGDYAELLADGEVDAVYIPLPNNLHAQWSIRALEAGKHVLCEKPLAANAEEAESMVATAERTGRVLAEAFHYRYHPLAQRVRDLVQEGAIGTLEHADIQFCTPSIRPNNIRFSYELAGGVTMDMGCYAVDMLRFLTGEEPTVIQAEAKLLSPQVDRTMDARFAFPSGATGHTYCSMLGTCLFRSRVRLRGSAGELSVFNLMLPHLLYHRLRIKDEAGVRTEKFPKIPTYDYQMQAFVEAVRDSAPLSADGSEGVKNMRVIDAIYRAAGLAVR